MSLKEVSMISHWTQSSPIYWGYITPLMENQMEKKWKMKWKLGLYRVI